MSHALLQPKIKTILDGITSLQTVYEYPAKKIDGYPAAITYLSSIGNSFETTADNFTIYNYKLFLIVSTEQTTMEVVHSTVMPTLFDETMTAFAQGWNFGTIGGYRTWCKIRSGDWYVTETQKGKDVAVEFDIEIKLLNSTL